MSDWWQGVGRIRALRPRRPRGAETPPRRTSQNRTSVDVSFGDLATAEPTLAVWLVNVPRHVLEVFHDTAYDVARELFTDVQALVPHLFVRIHGLPESDCIRDIRCVPRVACQEQPVLPAASQPSQRCPHRLHRPSCVLIPLPAMPSVPRLGPQPRLPHTLPSSPAASTTWTSWSRSRASSRAARGSSHSSARCTTTACPAATAWAPSCSTARSTP